MSDKRYPPQDPIALGHHYHVHVNALTVERLNGKAEIAEQLAWRDQTIEGLRSDLARATALLTEISTLYRQEHEQIAPLLAAAARALPEPHSAPVQHDARPDVLCLCGACFRARRSLDR